jgi:hypothetical protein
MKVLICIISLIISFKSSALDCKKRPLACQIYTNRLKVDFPIDSGEALLLEKAISRIAVKHNIDPHLYAAMLMQENKYRLDSKGCHKAIINKGKKVTINTKICQDFGMSQINWRTAQSLKMDIPRMLKDVEYSLESGAIILADFKKRYSKKEKHWWTRYNASNPEKRKVYQKLVEKYHWTKQ